MDLTEEWRPVVGYEGAYEVSSMGRVRGLDRITYGGRTWRGQMLTPAVMPRGYLVVTLWGQGRQRSALVHRLVLTAFRGLPAARDEGRHLNGDPADNSLQNLAWGSHGQNQYDQVAHGRHANAAKTHCAHGHPFNEANTYRPAHRKARICRACRRAYMKRYNGKLASA